jgi:hypothetical protein
MADFTLKQLQRLAHALGFTGASDPYLSIDEKRDIAELIKHVNELMKGSVDSPAVQVGHTYLVDSRGHWANGKLVTVDRVANGQASFYTIEQPTGHGILTLDAFQPKRPPPGISLNRTYQLETEDPMNSPRVVVVQLPLDQSTAVVHVEGKPGELFCCLCAKLKAVDA